MFIVIMSLIAFVAFEVFSFGLLKDKAQARSGKMQSKFNRREVVMELNRAFV